LGQSSFSAGCDGQRKLTFLALCQKFRHILVLIALSGCFEEVAKMLKFAVPVALALMVSSVPAEAAHKCKCHHVHKAKHKIAHKPVKKKHWVAARPVKLVKIVKVAPTVRTRKVTTTTTVTRTVHYSPPQVIERPIYVDRPVYMDRPVYVERPVYYERRVPVYRPIPVYHTRTIVTHPQPVVYRRAHFWRRY
jgi:hypothetical protein